MLDLSRKYQEKIRIGNGITITVLRTKGKAVRLGIEAPADVPVIRGELAFEHSPAATSEFGDGSSHSDSDSPPGPAVPHQTPVGSMCSRFESCPRATQGTAEYGDARQVVLRRVPRDTAEELLPRLLISQSPLRQMLNERTGT